MDKFIGVITLDGIGGLGVLFKSETLGYIQSEMSKNIDPNNWDNQLDNAVIYSLDAAIHY